MSLKKIRILIVDDSAVIRKILSHVFSQDPDIEVVGTAPDPYVARDLLVQLKPDLVTLDIEMPRMDGISFLEKVMEHFPTRVVVISSLTKANSELALRALEIGAIDVIQKPTLDVSRVITENQKEFISKIKMAARARLSVPVKGSGLITKALARPANTALAQTTHQVLAVASSTGGTEALKVFLKGFSAAIPGTVIVQHMPQGFTKLYADHLNQMFPFEVKEAEEGDRVVPGRVLIAPGNRHMELCRTGAYYMVRLHDQPLLHGVRPAADFLMKSVAKYAGSNAVGVVLTGMGRDGAEGLLAMKNAGAYNLAQNEESCVVYGMPKAAVELNAVHRVLHLRDLSHAVNEQMKLKEVA